MNSLADPRMIQALYQASQCGVEIDLIVRGICCLRPGVPGQSENITVRSVVDRFLEHCRVYYFENACQPEIFLASADWLPRNFFRRIELAFPILDGRLRERIMKEILGIALADNVKARVLQPDGGYVRLSPLAGEGAQRSQAEFIRLSSQPDARLAQPAVAKSRHPKVKLMPRPAALGRRKQVVKQS